MCGGEMKHNGKQLYSVFIYGFKVKKIMGTNLEKAKRLTKAHATIKGIDLPEDNYFFKMLELAATPDIINKNDVIADVVSSKLFTDTDMLNAYIRGFKDADINESGLGLVKKDVIIENGIKWLKEYHK